MRKRKPFKVDIQYNIIAVMSLNQKFLPNLNDINQILDMISMMHLNMPVYN